MMEHKFLNEEFQYKPRIAWVTSTNNGGYSITNARLLTQMGYDGLFLGGVSNELFDQEEDKEFIWRPSMSTFGEELAIFTHMIMDNNPINSSN